jgi:hypothetical protein
MSGKSGDGWQWFEALARLAAAEQRPTPDVVRAVRYRLASRPAEILSLAWASRLAGVCTAAAMVCGWLGYQAWTVLADPWSGWLLGGAG